MHTWDMAKNCLGEDVENSIRYLHTMISLKLHNLAFLSAGSTYLCLCAHLFCLSHEPDR